MHRYWAYGLLLQSELKIPELVEAVGADRSRQSGLVMIRFGTVPPLPCEERGERLGTHARPEAVSVYLEAVGRALIRGGQEIIVEPADGGSRRLLGNYITGVCFGVLLHQRGLLVLHASAVEVEGHVVAFIGDKGWGKSTMAARPVRARPLPGHGRRPPHPRRRARRRLRLPELPPDPVNPDSARAALDADLEDLDAIDPHFAKRA